jgi:4-hydroxybenzoyl-CoA thioesterase
LRPIETGAAAASAAVEPSIPFIHRIRVGWADCDPARIAYTGRIPCFALEAIDAWWEHRIGQDWFGLNVDSNLGTPFVHLDVDFRSPVTPRAPLECHVHLVKLGEKSIGFRVRGFQDGTLCFEGSFTSVFVIADNFEPIPIPDHIRGVIAPLVVAAPC